MYEQKAFLWAYWVNKNRDIKTLLLTLIVASSLADTSTLYTGWKITRVTGLRWPLSAYRSGGRGIHSVGLRLSRVGPLPCLYPFSVSCSFASRSSACNEKVWVECCWMTPDLRTSSTWSTGVSFLTTCRSLTLKTQGTRAGSQQFYLQLHFSTIFCGFWCCT